MRKFDGAELTIYGTDGSEYTIGLSALETKIVLTVLGIKPTSETTITAYGTETQQAIINGDFNPFGVKEV